jgi:methylenetetrahydrofolate--tRNA-(uracil-5-)-methyltransferase
MFLCTDLPISPLIIMSNKSVSIIGAGLAGCEAALVLSRRGIPVKLYEMRPGRMTPAHRTGLPAELVCSNSLKSRELPGAHGLLKHELALLQSPLLEAAGASSVPAGSALAVDRGLFSRTVEQLLRGQPGITRTECELTRPPADIPCIIATGPLTSDALASWLASQFSGDSLWFYDAIAPIISGDSVDMSTAFFASRWEKDAEGGDYLNCPFTEEEYRRFHAALMEARQIDARQFEDARFFEACLPVEEIGRRGDMALAFGPLKPVGIIDPKTGRRPFAVCQLRRENVAGDSYNLVGFQTRLSFPEQQRVFRMIPGLAHAEILRYGSIHRNTYLDSPRLLGEKLEFIKYPGLFAAGQLCGNEGYTESIATGHLAGLFVAALLSGSDIPCPPKSTALGALLNHVTGSPDKRFTPANINFSLFPPLQPTGRKVPKTEKHRLLCQRALQECAAWKLQFMN